MATLLIESLSHNKTSFQIAARAIEILLLSAGLVSTFIMFKGAVSPYSYDLMLSNLRKPFSYFRSWLPSSFYICIILNLVVILIGVSSLYQHPKMDKNCDVEDDGDGFEDYDMHGALPPSLSPPPAPPPMQNNPQKHNQEPKPKEIFVVAETATAAVTASKKGGGKTNISTASLKNQQDTRDTNDVDKFDAFFQEGLSDFSRLTEAKEIKKAPTTKGAGGKTKNATASLKNQQDRTMDTNGVEKVDDESFEANFTDFSKFTEVKEIKKPHSVESSPQFITIQKTTKTSTTKNGQQTLKGVGNQFGQTQKQPENEEGEEEVDTMEATWRSIFEGGTKPQKKQLKKSETWPQPQTVAADQDNNNESDEVMPSSAAAWKEMRKSMTFNDTVSIRCKGGLRRDLSMTLEEFNQDVEAFIKNFKIEMRLQRQESEQRYLDMISRGL